MNELRKSSGKDGLAALVLNAAGLRIWTDPIVSVVIPVFNEWKFTRACLLAVLFSDSSVPLEIVVVDDGSTDETIDQLSLFPHVVVVQNEVNAGFLRSCNRGAAVASGKYFLFLNNDAVVDEMAIAALVERAQNDPKIGIVGSKLLFPNGKLQEAGGIIWSDARGYNYGRNDDAQKSQYNFVRDVDYVSGASLLVRGDLFRGIGGFDERFAPAYYEDADLCFAVRASGKRVVYEPASIVVHHEGATSGTDLTASVKQYQNINRLHFLEKWKTVLDRDHVEADSSRIEAAARARGEHRSALLFVDEALPPFDRDAGASRLRSIMVGLASSGVRVVFYPDNLKPVQPYTRDLQSCGIEVVYSEQVGFRWQECLATTVATVDAAWVCRPGLIRHYLPAIREISDIPIAYDTIDLHYLRLKGQAEIEGRFDDPLWRELQELETTCAFAADATIAVSEVERDILKSSGVFPVYVIRTVHDLEVNELRNFFSTEGLLFIGGFKHQPNIDAIHWLVEEIMPLIWQSVPTVSLTLLGASPPNSIKVLGSERIRVPGYIPDVAPYFRAARLFVAPLRYGAGVKGKIGQALSFRLPVVTTKVGAEGFNFRSGVDAVIADDAASFSAAVVNLYGDPDLWSALSYRSARVLRPFNSDAVVAKAHEMLADLLRSEKHLARGTVD